MSHYQKTPLNSLNIFSIPNIQNAITGSQYVNYYPVSDLTEGAPIEFNIFGNGQDYIALQDTLLFLRVKIVDADGKKLKPTSKVGFINIPLQSLWSQVDVSFNQKLVTPSSTNYGYKAYISTLLNYGKQAQRTQLSSELFYKDSPLAMDETNTITGSNTGLLYRAQYTKESKSVDLQGALHIDAFKTDRLLLNGIDIRLKLWRSATPFVLISPEDKSNFKVIIQEAVLKMHKIKVNPAIAIMHAQLLKSVNAKYPIMRSDLKTISLPKGSQQVNIDDLFHSYIPNKLIITMVTSVAMNGNYTKNPFNFQNFDVNSIAVYVNGESLPTRPMKINYNGNKSTDANYVEAYQSLFMGNGKLGQDCGLNITRNDFVSGYALYLFNLSNLQDEWYLKQGNTRLEIQYAKPLPETISLIAYGEFPQFIEIDSARNIILQ